MKRFITVLVLILLSSTSLAASERKINESINLSKPDAKSKIDVSLYRGSITIEGYKGKGVEISAKIKGLENIAKKSKSQNSPKKESKEAADPRLKGLKKVFNTAVQLEIEEDDNVISISSMNRKQHIDLILKVPFSADLELVVQNGDDIKISNVHGDIEVINARGGITATGVKGTIVAECARNDLTVVFEKFSTQKPSSLNAHRGSIDVSLPKNSQVAIEVKNYQGEIYSGIDAEFENTDSVKNQTSSGGQQITIGEAMLARMNGGTQKLMLNTYRGNVYVREH